MTATMIVKVDDLYYAGEDLDSVIEADFGGEGWHVTNHGGFHPLKFTENIKEAKKIFGNRLLMSHMDAIIRRVKYGELYFETITIEKVKK